MKFKKILSILLISMLLCSLLCLPAFAEDGQFSDKLKISEDYQNVIYQGKLFTKVDSDTAETGDYNTLSDSEIELTPTQTQEIKSISAYYYNLSIELDIVYNKGGSGYYYYVASEAYDEYIDIANGKGHSYFIESNSSYDVLEIKHSQLLGKMYTIEGYKLNYYPRYGQYSLDSSYVSVYTTSKSGSFSKVCGYIFKDTSDNRYTYVELSQFEKDDLDFENYPSVTVYEITDPVLISELDLLITVQNNNIENNENISEIMSNTFLTICAVLLSLLFGVLPLIGLILCLIRAFKSTKPYKKMLFIATALIAVELLIFITIAILIIVL